MSKKERTPRKLKKKIKKDYNRVFNTIDVKERLKDIAYTLEAKQIFIPIHLKKGRIKK